MSASEQARLAAGQVVSRELTVNLPSGRFIGGVSYAIIDAPADVVMRVILDVDAYREILPLALEAREVGRRDADRFVYFRHGNRIGTASYICQVRPVSGTLVRFWMDRSRPHDFEDAWGYFRVDPLGPGRSLLTYAGLIDLGFGFVRFFFEEKVRHYLLSTPELVQTYVRKQNEREAEDASAAAPSEPATRGNVRP